MSGDQKQNVIMKTVEQERAFKQKSDEEKKSSPASCSDEDGSDKETGKKHRECPCVRIH